jgi:hypothetical protein
MTATAATVTDAATGALVRTVRLGKNHTPLRSIARALESSHPGTRVTFDFSQSPRAEVFNVVLHAKIAPDKALHRFRVELQA